EEAKATILHLRESLVQQKEMILDQRETIRELMAKLTVCEGLGRGPASHVGPGGKHGAQGDVTSSPEQMERMLQALKERLDNMQQKRNTSLTYSNSLKELLQRKISTLEQQLHHSLDEKEHHHRKTGFHSTKLDSMLNQLHLRATETWIFSKRKPQSPEAFQISFPVRSDYMHGRLRKTLLQEIFALTLCLWIKAGAAPGMGTPFSYSAPGQANELVLIEWGSNPMELLVNDKAVALPLSLSDGKWHHVCVTWSTRDGQWEAYQDGVQRGSGNNLSPWHPVKPGGVFILGQEQDALGGRFDASQSFVGEMSDLHLWSRVLTAGDIHSLASCGSHLQGDVLAWSEEEVELHGGVSSYPFEPC
uniref:Si:dkey-283b15.2 n=1 Tax=Tetraodon nigroviridis TaxID=99883 RepID=H3C5F5_TETNG